MDLQEYLEVGKQAEEFNRYINEHPYFLSLLDRIKLEYSKTILGLRPEEKDRFSLLTQSIIALDDIMNNVRGDIALGADAFSRMNSEPRIEGIL